jgi:hypothetical protein
MVITGGRAVLSGPDREAPTPVTIKTNNKYLGEKDFSITIQIRTLPQKELGSNTRR